MRLHHNPVILPHSAQEAITAAYNELLRDDQCHKSLVHQCRRAMAGPRINEMMTRESTELLRQNVAIAFRDPQTEKILQHLHEMYFLRVTVDMVVDTLLMCRHVPDWHGSTEMVRSKTTHALLYYRNEIEALRTLRSEGMTSTSKMIEYVWKLAVMNTAPQQRNLLREGTMVTS